jgi:hypothetical protein
LKVAKNLQTDALPGFLALVSFFGWIYLDSVGFAGFFTRSRSAGLQPVPPLRDRPSKTVPDALHPLSASRP